MIIKGLQKTTLLDFPGKVACTVFTAGCNFRCPFCHNASLVIDSDDINEISENDFFSYISKRKGILDGVCITGGEPLMAHGIEKFITKIKEIGLLVKLDTNGTFPEKLEMLLDNGLVDYVAMDIKNCKEKYALTAGTKNFPLTIEKSIKIIMNKAPDYEFRTTVVKELHKKEDFEKISTWIKGAKRYFLQCFKDNENLIGNNLSAYTPLELEGFLEVLKNNIDEVKLRGV